MTILCIFKPYSNSKLAIVVCGRSWSLFLRNHISFSNFNFNTHTSCSNNISFIHSSVWQNFPRTSNHIFHFPRSLSECFKVLNITHYVRTNDEQVNVENFDFPYQISRQSDKDPNKNGTQRYVDVRVYVCDCVCAFAWYLWRDSLIELRF